MAEQVVDGVWRVGRYSPYKVGAWVLTRGSEAALLEMPPGQAGRSKPWDDVRSFVDERRLTVRWLLLSHVHIDHTFGYPDYRRTFPEARLLVHRSFLDWYRREIFDDVFVGESKELVLGGEPLVLLHAPKHSPQDTLVLFRGACCTGDWSLGPHPDCNPSVGATTKVKTLEALRRFLDERPYVVHTLYSAHGDEVRRDVDFGGMLQEMRDYWVRVREEGAWGAPRAWRAWNRPTRWVRGEGG